MNAVWCVMYVTENGDRLLSSVHASEASAEAMRDTMEPGHYMIESWAVHGSPVGVTGGHFATDSVRVFNLPERG